MSLACLAAAPWIVLQRTARLQREILDVADPGRALVTRVQYEIALEEAGSRGWLLTGDESYLASYRTTRAERERDIRTLLPLARTTGPGLEAEVLGLQEDLRASDAELDSFLKGRIPRQDFPAQLSRRQVVIRTVLERAAGIDSSFGEAIAVRRGEVRHLFWLAGVLETVFVFLALIAALEVARLGRRQRELAIRLEHHSDRQAALREVARALGVSESLRDALHAIVDGAVATTRAMGAYVERADWPVPGVDVEVVAGTGVGWPPIGTRIPYPGSLTEKMIESGEPELMTEVGAIGARMAPYLRETCGGCSGLIVPLLSGGHVLGALVLLRGADERHFTREEAAHARALGDLSSAALRRVLLIEQLTESDRRFRLVTDHLRQVIWLGNPERTVRYFVNPAYEEVFGRSMESFLRHPQSINESVHPDDRARVLQALEVLPFGIYEERYRIVRPDGQIRWIWSRAYPIRDETGEVFTRVESAGEKRGAGIGLAIAQAVAGALDGDITVESEKGVGSTFTLWLPIGGSRGEPPGGGSPKTTAGTLA